MYKISLLLATMYELVNHPTLTVLPCLSSDHINNPVREGGSIITPSGQMITQVQRRDSLTYDPWGQHLPFVYGVWIYRLMSSLRFLILKYIYFVSIIISSLNVSSSLVMKIIDSITLRKKIPTKFIWAFPLQSILIIILSLL